MQSRNNSTTTSSHTVNQLEGMPHTASGGICSQLMRSFFSQSISTANMVDQDVAKLDAAILRLEGRVVDLRRKEKEGLVTLKNLKDESVRITGGITRKSMETNCRLHLKMVMKQIATIENQINIFVRAKINIENSIETHAMAANIADLKKSMSTIEGIDLDELQENFDTIDDTNREIENINNLISDTVKVNILTSDMTDDLDREIDEYLAASDSEDEIELTDPYMYDKDLSSVPVPTSPPELQKDAKPSHTTTGMETTKFSEPVMLL